ncbi:MAG: nitroreductase family protein [Candidatus Omnitrophota bacterium]
MDIFKVINTRHSYRGEFTDEPVGRADLVKIVNAGICAPSGKNCQTTEFVIVDDREKLQSIGSMHTMPAMRTAKAMILCIIPYKPETVYEGHSFAVEDCSAAVENMFLAITALGYASVWIDGWLRVCDRARMIGDIIGLCADKKVRVLLPIGVPSDKITQAEKKPFIERCWFNMYRSEP